MAQLSIDIVAKIASFQRGLNSMERDARRTSKRIATAIRGIGVAVGVVSTLVGGGLALGLGSIVDRLDDISKKSQGLGLTVEKLSELRSSASFAGLEVGEFDNAIAKLNRRLIDAQDGLGEAVKTFDKLGLDPNQFATVDKLLVAIAQKFKEMPKGANKVALALKLFEETGYRFVPLLNQGAEGFERMGEAAQRANAIISTETALAAAQLKDQMNQLGQQLSGVAVYLAGPLIEGLARAAKAFNAAEKAGNSFAILGKSTPAFALDQASKRGIEIQKQIQFLEDKLKNTSLDADNRETLGKLLKRLKAEIPAVTAEIDRLKAALNQVFPVDPNEPLKFPKMPPFSPLTAQSSPASKELERAAAEFKSVQESMDRLIFAAQERAADRLDAQRKTSEDLASSIKDAINPARELQRELRAAQDLVNEGLLTEEQFKSYQFVLNRQRKDLQALGEQSQETKAIFDDVAAKLTLGFEDAMFEGERLSQILKQLAIDVAKLLVRQSITKPLIGAILGAFQPAPIQNRNDSFIPASSALTKAVPAGSGGPSISIGNLAADVSLAQVEAVVEKGVRRGQAQIYESRERGGAFA